MSGGLIKASEENSSACVCVCARIQISLAVCAGEGGALVVPGCIFTARAGGPAPLRQNSPNGEWVTNENPPHGGPSRLSGCSASS